MPTVQALRAAAFKADGRLGVHPYTHERGVERIVVVQSLFASRVSLNPNWGCAGFARCRVL